MRGAGRTTEQLKKLPLNAVFVWVSSDLSYPRALLEKIKRQDIELVPPSWIRSYKWQGRVLTGFAIDHATKLTDKEFLLIEDILARIR